MPIGLFMPHAVPSESGVIMLTTGGISGSLVGYQNDSSGLAFGSVSTDYIPLLDRNLEALTLEGTPYGPAFELIITPQLTSNGGWSTLRIGSKTYSRTWFSYQLSGGASRYYKTNVSTNDRPWSLTDIGKTYEIEFLP